MGLFDRTAAWFKRESTLVRRVEEAGTAVGSGLAKGAPLLKVTTELPELLETVHAYRAAREAVITFGGQMFRNVYKTHLADLGNGLRKASTETRAHALLEIRAFHRFIEDVETLAAIVAEARSLGRPALDEVDSAILRRVTEGICEADHQFAEEVRGLWREFQSAVEPKNEEAWKEILTVSKRAAKKRAGLAEGQFAAERSQAGHLSTIQGSLFENYGRYSQELAEEYDDMLRVAAFKAARLGEGWEPMRIFGELHLSAVDASTLNDLSKGARQASDLPWSQFADSSIVAARLPKQGTSGLGEIDISALFQYKAEAGDTGLIEQSIGDLFRTFEGASGKTVLARFNAIDEHGELKEYVCVLRPPDARDPMTFYAIATSNTDIPDTAVLGRMGVNLRRINLRPSRDDMRDLADMFFWAVMDVVK